jgi:cell division protease FtsH
MFGGRIAEEIVFGLENVTTGASNDIQQATAIARRMVMEFGFSDKLGRLRYASDEEEIFLGHSVAQRKNVSDATARIIDEEIRRLIDDAEVKARKILNERRKDLETLAQALLEHESLSGDEVKAVLRGETIVRPEETPPAADRGAGRKASVPSSGKGPASRRPIGTEPQTEP